MKSNPVHPVKTPWPKVRLGELLQRSDETIEPQADAEYREITVRLWGNGVVERGRILGASLSGRRFVAHSGQFSASRIDARNGAMGLVPESLNDALQAEVDVLKCLQAETAADLDACMIWVDAHLPPALATWITAEFGEAAQSVRDV